MTNKTYQFYGEGSTISIGFIDGFPYLAANPKLTNPTDKRKYDYSKDRSVFFVFNKLEDIVKMSETLGVILDSPVVKDDEVIMAKKVDVERNIIIQGVIFQMIPNGTKISILDDIKKLEVIYINDLDRYDIKIMKKFFDVALEEVIRSSMTQIVAAGDKDENTRYPRKSYSYMKDKTVPVVDSKPKAASESDFDAYMEN